MKTTKKHFELFKKECKKWIEFFGLKEWNVSYDWCTPVEDCVLAWSNHHFSAKSSYLILSKEWRNTVPVTNEQVKKSAFHEVCEMMLFPLRYMSECRFLSDTEIDPEIHRLIRTFENVIFKC